MSLFIDAAGPCQHSPGERWFVDETYVKVCGRWCYLNRPDDQFGQVIDVLLLARRDATAARAFFDSGMTVTQTTPSEVATDRPPAANNPIECDRGRLKARLRPMNGLKG